MDRIDELIFSLEKNEISGILKTRLGFHIFMVEDKKSFKVKELNEVKDIVEAKIFEEKAKEKSKKWILELKRDAYIAFR